MWRFLDDSRCLKDSDRNPRDPSANRHGKRLMKPLMGRRGSLNRRVSRVQRVAVKGLRTGSAIGSVKGLSKGSMEGSMKGWVKGSMGGPSEGWRN